MEILKNYESDSGDETKSAKHGLELDLSILPQLAPDVQSTQNTEKSKFKIMPNDKVVLYNPTYEELYSPQVGPINPYKNKEQKSFKNCYTGQMFKSTFNEAMFDNQRLTFHYYGYGVDPSIDKNNGEIIGDTEAFAQNNNKFIREMKTTKLKDNRVKQDWGKPEDIDNFRGPWRQYVDEVKSYKPDDEQLEILQHWIKQKEAKKEIVKRQEEPELITECSIMHLSQPVDYQGRSFMVPPQDIGVNFRDQEGPDMCYLPTKLMFTWRGHAKGINCFKTFPGTGHLMLTGSYDTTIKLWEVYKERRLIITYKGHRDPIKDISFDNDGKRFLSSSIDRYIKLWDTETGQCIGRYTTNKIANCVRFNPDEDKQNFFIAAMADKKMVTWDINSNEIVQEYDRHLGPVNSVTFIENNQRLFSTSDDRTIRVWDWDIPVDSKYIADGSLHIMPSVTLSPCGRYIACQSMDNKIIIFDVANKVREKRRKVFRGHVLSGNHCQVAFSPDGKYIMSGDGEGKCNIWNFKTTKLLSRFQAHDQPVMGCAWLPHETSKIMTASLDGLIKLWD